MAKKKPGARKRATDDQQTTRPKRIGQRPLDDGIDEVDREMLKRIIARPSVTNLELTQELGYKDRKSIGKRRERSIFQKELKRIQDELTKDAIQIAKETQSEAIRKVAQIMRLDLKEHAYHALSAAKFIARGIPEIASGLLKPEHADTENLTRAELEGTAELALEIAKRPAANKG